MESDAHFLNFCLLRFYRNKKKPNEVNVFEKKGVLVQGHWQNVKVLELERLLLGKVVEESEPRFP